LLVKEQNSEARDQWRTGDQQHTSSAISDLTATPPSQQVSQIFTYVTLLLSSLLTTKPRLRWKDSIEKIDRKRSKKLAKISDTNH
jgi:hypothetical protein